MPKIIQYTFVSAEINTGSIEHPVIEKMLLQKQIECSTEIEFSNNYKIAESEACSEILVTGEFDEIFVEPTAQDDTDAMLVDHEYRLTLLELGLTE